jgi:hypothetical protein
VAILVNVRDVPEAVMNVWETAKFVNGMAEKGIKF